MRLPLASLLLVLPLAACGSSTTGPGGTAGTDASPPTDGGTTVLDSALVADAPVPPTDGARTDSAFATDFGPDGDAGVPDASRPPLDGGPSTPLAGRWRAVRYDFTATDGGVTHLTDHDIDMTAPSGMTFPFRINGILSLAATRFSLSFGLQGSGHFYLYDNTPGGTSDDYSASGFTLPGLLDESAGTFTAPGGSATLQFTRNADGTITLASMDPSGSSSTTFAPAPPTAPVTTLNLLGYVALQHPERATPMAHPRASILWDPVVRGTVIETSGTALALTLGYGSFAVVQTTPPPADAIGTVAGVSVALGFTFVYDDVNQNGRFDPAGDAGTGDVVRAVGPVTIVWRGAGTPTAAWGDSPFVDVIPGYQLAHLHQDLLPTGWTVAPYDTTMSVSPDVPVPERPITDPVPHLVH